MHTTTASQPAPQQHRTGTRTGHGKGTRRALLVLSALCFSFAATIAVSNLGGGQAEASIGVDDYPLRATNAESTARDSWGFGTRQCVSFTAWRLRQHEQKAFTNHMAFAGKQVTWGSAYQWDDTARRAGLTISATPRVGAIAQWNSGEQSTYKHSIMTAGELGHVAYVVAVNADGSAVMEEYNGKVELGYSTRTTKAPRYIYFE